MLQNERHRHEKNRTWHVDRTEWPDGPWDQEPEDRIEWRDAGTGLPCVMVRNSDGAWCGYVGTPPGHPSHEVTVDFELEITYGRGQCSWPVCHTPAPGETDRFRWIGFDCGHGDDIVPARRWAKGCAVYRTRDWVRDHVTLLANKLAGILPPEPKAPPTDLEIAQRKERARNRQRSYAKKRRARLAKAELCINNAAHGKATHGCLCRACRATHRQVPIEQVPAVG